MSEPFYDETEHLFGIDVILNDFDGQYAAGMNLLIEYSNTDFIIDQTKTEASLFGNLANIKVGLDFGTPGVIELSGTQPPYDDGPELTAFSEQNLYTIYYSAEAGACADFTFTMTDILVSFPPSSWSICNGGIGSGCEPLDVCLEDFTLSGLIESPVLNCENSHDGGINAIDVEFQESYNVDAFNGSEFTDSYGEYEHQVVGGLDYRITPVHDYYRACGLSSLDVDIIHDHIICSNLVDYEWQLICGDVNQSGTLSSTDIDQIEYAIMDVDNLTWPSWTFVPATQYNSMTLPSSCLGGTYNNVPSYTPYIDVADVSIGISNLDFVGIKMGDANGNCTECSNPFTGPEKLYVRSAPTEVNLIETGRNEFALSFNKNIQDLEVIFIAFTCEFKPEILSSPWLGAETFATNYKNGIFYVAYTDMNNEGFNIPKNEPFMIIGGKLENSVSAGNPVQNEMIVNNVISSLTLKKSKQLYYDISPNPNHGDFSVLIQPNDLVHKPEFKLFDVNGQLMINKMLTQIRTPFSIPLSKGIYVYKIDMKNKFETGKLIIQ